MKFGVRLLLVVLGAGLGILVFPPVGWSAFAVMAWLPLVFALSDAKPAHAFYPGLLHGVLFFGVTMRGMGSKHRNGAFNNVSSNC